MIFIRNEGELVRNGFNFYPFKSDHIGFTLYWNHKKIFQIRYNKMLGLLWVGKKDFQIKKANIK